jgi:hypothetical protein
VSEIEPKKTAAMGHGLPIGMGVGAALGVAFGAAFNDIALGLSFGAAFGLGLEATFSCPPRGVARKMTRTDPDAGPSHPKT